MYNIKTKEKLDIAQIREIFTSGFKPVETHKIGIEYERLPVFNDTYKVDNRIITGPYLHCTDPRNRRLITAKDFFSLDITDSNKELYRLMEADYISVWEQSSEYFDNEKLLDLFDSHDKFDKIMNMQSDERIKLIRGCIVSNSSKDKKTPLLY